MIITHNFSVFNLISSAKTTLFCALLLLVIKYDVYAQNQGLYFDSFKVKDGLPNSSVISIGQDSVGYIWAVTKYGLCRYDGRNFRIFKHENNRKSISSNEFLNNILLDNKKRLWIASKELDLYDSKTESFKRIPTKTNEIKTIYCDSRNRLWIGSDNLLEYMDTDKPEAISCINFNMTEHCQITAIYEDYDKHIWIGTTKGLFKINLVNRKAKIERITNSLQKYALSSENITSITEDKERNMWIGTREDGINLYDRKTGKFHVFKKDKFNKNSLIGNHIRKILRTKDGTLWIGTQEGLSILNPKKLSFSNFQHDSSNPHSLSHNSIHDIYQDKNGSVWIGTFFGGLNVVHTVNTHFSVFQNNIYQNSISSNIISAITKDASNNLWIGTEAGGLNYLDKSTGKITTLKNDPYNRNSLSSNLVKAIAIDHNGKVYIGTAIGGLNIYDPFQKKFENYLFSRQKVPAGMSGDDVKCLLITDQNKVLFGTDEGLKIFIEGQKKIRPISSDKSNQVPVTSLFQDSEKSIWVGTGSGVAKLTSANRLEQINFTDKNHTAFKSAINCFQQDNPKQIWVGTYHQGLVLLNKKDLSYKVFTTSDGLPSNNVLGILTDTLNNLWISTDNGLSRFDTKHLKFQNLTVDDGLPDNQFNKGSYYKYSDSLFYFGTYNGMISFNPYKIARNTYPPKVVFSSVRLFNTPLSIDDQFRLLKGDLNSGKTLTFNHNQNVFTIEFTALNFIKSSKNKYAYKLDGFDKNWNYVDVPSATYNNLSAGTYRLLAKAANNDGVWNDQPSVIVINILPAPWKTWWAYLIYFIICTILFIYIRRFLRARLQLRQELFRERIEAEHQKASYQQQLDFFTNISHEIRTPLTLILGPIERLANLKIQDSSAQQYITSIKNNTNRLYRLVTELLDFRKADSDNLKLYVCEGDIVKFLKDIYYSFQSTAEIKGIDFQFHTNISALTVYYDSDQLEKVFSNLFINAIKFTQSEGTVSISIVENQEDNVVNIYIEDNGKGIRNNELDNIFENFYQVSPSIGSGIGLALSKRLVELHKGKIIVNSKVSTIAHAGFTSFLVSLKLGKDHFTDAEFIYKNATPSNDVVYINTEYESNLSSASGLISGHRKHTILLVEDNDEVRDFIRQSLENNYHIIESRNGEEGLKYAITTIPDLIISDVMMPIMDGLELCTKVKADLRTCHIPVILLTAKSAPVHLIHGLQHGADAYVTKPFSSQVLHLNIHNMLILISAMQKKYSEQMRLEPLLNTHSTDDGKLLQRLQEIIQDNIANSDFDLSSLTKEIGMSKSVLYRKFSALTNQSLNSFIKSERLKNAVKFFQEGETSIITVAVKVGFNDVKYFSREFKKQYNITPNEYLNSKESLE